MRVYGAWIKRYRVLCSKRIVPRAVCYKFPLVHNKLLGAPAFVRLIYTLSFHVNRQCHSWDTAISKFDLEKSMTKVMDEVKVKSQKSQVTRLHIDSHPFVSCQSAIRFLGYGLFKIWPCKSKVKVTTQGHTVGPISYRLTSFSPYVNLSSHSWDTAVSKFDLENRRSRSWWGESQGHTISLTLIQCYPLLFHVNRPKQ